MGKKIEKGGIKMKISNFSLGGLKNTQLACWWLEDTWTS